MKVNDNGEVIVSNSQILEAEEFSKVVRNKKQIISRDFTEITELNADLQCINKCFLDDSSFLSIKYQKFPQEKLNCLVNCKQKFFEIFKLSSEFYINFTSNKTKRAYFTKYSHLL